MAVGGKASPEIFGEGEKMATIEQLRLKILDKPQVVIGEKVGVGDGSKAKFKLKLVPIMDESVTLYIDGEVLEEENYELDYETGVITFDSAPEEGEAVVADYGFTAFSDSDLQEFLDESGGNLAMAAGNALMSLLADRNRMVSWSRSEGRIDYDRLRKDISETASRFLKQGMSESGSKTDEVDWEEVS